MMLVTFSINLCLPHRIAGQFEPLSYIIVCFLLLLPLFIDQILGYIIPVLFTVVATGSATC